MIWQNYEINGRFEKKQVPLSEPNTINKGTWIEINCPTPEEVEWARTNLELPPEFIKSALDERKQSHQRRSILYLLGMEEECFCSCLYNLQSL